MVTDRVFLKKGSIGRISEYIDEKINFSDYGSAVEGITYSPTISKILPEQQRSHKNQYLRSRKEWFLNIDLDYDKAIRMNDSEYDRYVLEGLLQCLDRPRAVKGFDKAAFKRDIIEIIEGLLQQAA